MIKLKYCCYTVRYFFKKWLFAFHCYLLSVLD
uniref:Uncharacterized protein n=1 Tax=Anguilla anguilla TaxID=7936 RepID=A0A0E9TTI3_ANGAN